MLWKEIIKKAVEDIDNKIKTTERQVKDAVQAANDSPSRMESRYDSYREEYSMQAAAIGGNLLGLRLLKEFFVGLLSGQGMKDNDEIMLGALIKLDYGDGEEDEYLLLVPNNGGDEIEIQGMQVRTVSIRSSLGNALTGHRIGEKISYTIDQTNIVTRIADIQKG